MNVTEVTTAAAWITGLAIVALIATGWRKTARATADPARARFTSRAPTGLEVTDTQAPAYRPARWYKRLWAALASGVLAVWIGAVVATIIGFGAAFAVIHFTDLLSR